MFELWNNASVEIWSDTIIYSKTDSAGVNVKLTKRAGPSISDPKPRTLFTQASLNRHHMLKILHLSDKKV